MGWNHSLLKIAANFTPELNGGKGKRSYPFAYLFGSKKAYVEEVLLLVLGRVVDLSAMNWIWPPACTSGVREGLVRNPLITKHVMSSWWSLESWEGGIQGRYTPKN